MSDLFMRDGHLSDLSLERILAGELKDAHALGHVQTCTVCKTRFEALQSHEQSFQAPPLSLPSVGPSYQPARWIAPLVACAAAALLYFGVFRQPSPESSISPQLHGRLDGPDTFRIKGSVNVEFSVKRGDTVRALHTGDVVHPGDRVGFRVASPDTGYLMILGIDGRNEPYLCYPQNNGGRSKPFGPHTKLKNLNEAIVLDDIIGQEELVALYCRTEVTYEDMAEALKKRRTQPALTTVLLNPNCRERRIVLDKKHKAGP